MAMAKPDGRGVHHQTLAGCTVLVVEDEYLIARDIGAALRDHGAHVAGLCPDLPSALKLLDGDQPIDGAVIDINLRGVRAFELADTLQRRGIGFVIATGYDVDILPKALATAPRCTKPINYQRLVRLLSQQMGACHQGHFEAAASALLD
jgi:CheY-like chemotaxis protein